MLSASMMPATCAAARRQRHCPKPGRDSTTLMQGQLWCAAKICRKVCNVHAPLPILILGQQGGGLRGGGVGGGGVGGWGGT